MPRGSTSQNVRDRPRRYAYRASGLVRRPKGEVHAIDLDALNRTFGRPGVCLSSPTLLARQVSPCRAPSQRLLPTARAGAMSGLVGKAADCPSCCALANANRSHDRLQHALSCRASLSDLRSRVRVEAAWDVQTSAAMPGRFRSRSGSAEAANPGTCSQHSLEGFHDCAVRGPSGASVLADGSAIATVPRVLDLAIHHERASAPCRNADL